MPSRAYEAVRYTTYPRIETHPDRLAAVATLAGMSPAPVQRCRVLEIGCGDGGNLVPMAYFLRDSEFLGVDLEPSAIAEGKQLARELKLRNVELRAADFRDLQHEAGTFDYILAHGLYSWIPQDARDSLMALCAERLAPQGVAYISYNTWPGRHERHILRQMLIYHHLRPFDPPRRRLKEARKLLAAIGTPVARQMAESSDDLLFHDDLASINDPVWFRNFAAHAALHNLQYLGDAGPGRRLPGDEQYFDFVAMRAFRQSLLCRAEVPLREPTAALMPRFLFSSPTISPLCDAYPLPLPFEELAPYDISPLQLFTLYKAGALDLHVFDFPCEESPGRRPRATKLARVQAKRSRFVTSVRHHLVELDESDRALILKLDGRRSCVSPRIEWFARMGLLE